MKLISSETGACQWKRTKRQLDNERLFSIVPGLSEVSVYDIKPPVDDSGNGPLSLSSDPSLKTSGLTVVRRTISK